MNQLERKRIAFVFFVFICAFTIVIGKAFKVQIVDADELMARAGNQFVRQATLYPKRGNIFDRSGNPLALNVQTYSIFTIPKVAQVDRQVYRKLVKIIPELSYQEITSKVRKRNKFTWLARKLSLNKDQVEKVKKLKGIFIEGVPQRVYPNKELLSQSLGFVGVDNSGLSGLEFMFDKELKGNPITLKYVIDNKGRPIKYESHPDVTAQAADVYLTIDKDIQSMAEKYLREGVEKHAADRGGVGIIDAETGEIIVIANYPAFDPNDVKLSRPEDRKLSFAIDPFEPGSAFKLFTVAAALENKVAKPNSNYYCEQGKMLIDGHVVSEAESHEKYEWLSVKDIVRLSSNIGTTKIAFDLKFPRFKETLKKLRIGEKTGIEIPGESRGIFTEAENVSALSLSNMSFGQGVAVTGVQMLAAYAALANGGTYHRPTIVKEIIGHDDIKKNESVKIFSKQTSDDITDMLVNAVDAGTGTNAQIPFFKIAGKTATAQRVDKYGGYKGYVSGFIGYPVNVEKRFVIYVYVDNPKKGGYYGNLVAAPIFKNIAQYLLYRDKSLKEVQLAKETTAPKSTEDLVKTQNAAARVINENMVPNFVGLDKVSSMSIASKLKIQLAHRGMGVVSSQDPAPGTPLTQGMIISLDYSPPKYE